MSYNHLERQNYTQFLTPPNIQISCIFIAHMLLITAVKAQRILRPLMLHVTAPEKLRATYSKQSFNAVILFSLRSQGVATSPSPNEQNRTK